MHGNNFYNFYNLQSILQFTQRGVVPLVRFMRSVTSLSKRRLSPADTLSANSITKHFLPFMQVTPEVCRAPPLFCESKKLVRKAKTLVVATAAPALAAVEVPVIPQDVKYANQLPAATFPIMD
jgi:hypothetical protein